MPRSQGQSDFVISRPLEGEGELPRAELHSSEASARATRWVMTIAVVMLVALALICAIGPHIPAGE